VKVAIGCDHGGIDLKNTVAAVLIELGHVVDDQGCNSTDSVDYPDFARSVSSLVKDGECECGILICGTGIGMSMAANRIPGIRAALCNEMFSEYSLSGGKGNRPGPGSGNSADLDDL
jgi:ribose 5-phosphate isomerase B